MERHCFKFLQISLMFGLMQDNLFASAFNLLYYDTDVASGKLCTTC